MFVLAFQRVALSDSARVGGKSAHLGDLARAGFAVPPGYAITTEAFDALVRDRVDALLAGLDLADIDGVERRSEAARELVEGLEIPTEIREAIAGAYDELGKLVGLDEPPVAVRSSAVAEDGADASFAGMQSTFLWRRGLDDVLDGVRRCFASYYNAEAIMYRAEHGSAAGMSVAVQYMVDARVAGVMFTLNPLNGDPSSIAIDASYGLGVTVVGGDVTPDTYLYSKVTRELQRSQIGSKSIECVVDRELGRTVDQDVDEERRGRLCLTIAEVEQLAELGRGGERHYGCPQDIEWAIDRDRNELFLLQARPETVWAQKRLTRVEPKVQDAIASIAATFMGGRSPK